MGTIRAAVGVFLLSTAPCATISADDDRKLLGVLLEQERARSRPWQTTSTVNCGQRGIEHDLSLEQSRVNALGVGAAAAAGGAYR